MKTYKISPNVISTKAKDEDAILICDLEKEDDVIYKIKDVSINFWKGLQTGLSKEAIVEDILSNYDNCNKKTVNEDFDHFIKTLITKNIIY